MSDMKGESLATTRAAADVGEAVGAVDVVGDVVGAIDRVGDVVGAADVVGGWCLCGCCSRYR